MTTNNINNNNNAQSGNTAMRWYYAGRRGGWWQYDVTSNDVIESAHRRQLASVDVDIEGTSYTVDLVGKRQYRTLGGRPRAVKRDRADADKKGVAGHVTSSRSRNHVIGGSGARSHAMVTRSQVRRLRSSSR